jgi:hypothetical protein
MKNMLYVGTPPIHRSLAGARMHRSQAMLAPLACFPIGAAQVSYFPFILFLIKFPDLKTFRFDF